MKLQILLALFVVAFAEEIAEEEGVLVLKTSNFDQAVIDHKYILVEFCEYSFSRTVVTHVHGIFHIVICVMCLFN